MKSSHVGTGTSAVEVLNISQNGLWLYVKGKEYFLPYDEFPWFRDARQPLRGGGAQRRSLGPSEAKRRFGSPPRSSAGSKYRRGETRAHSRLHPL